MGLFNILTNTVEGVIGTAINIAAFPIKAITDEDGSAGDDIVKYINKIGKDD